MTYYLFDRLDICNFNYETLNKEESCSKLVKLKFRCDARASVFTSFAKEIDGLLQVGRPGSGNFNHGTG